MEATARARPKKKVKKKRIIREEDLSPPPSPPTLDSFLSENLPSCENTAEVSIPDIAEEQGEAHEADIDNVQADQGQTSAEHRTPADATSNEQGQEQEETAVDAVTEETEKDAALPDESTDQEAPQEPQDEGAEPFEEDSPEEESSLMPSEDAVEPEEDGPSAPPPPPPSYDDVLEEELVEEQTPPPSYEDAVDLEPSAPPPKYEDALGEQDKETEETESQEEEDTASELETDTESDLSEISSEPIDTVTYQEEESEDNEPSNYNPNEDAEKTANKNMFVQQDEREEAKSEDESISDYEFEWDEHFETEYEEEENDIKKIEVAIQEKLRLERVELPSFEEDLVVSIQALTIDDGDTKAFVIVDVDGGNDKVQVGKLLVEVDNLAIGSELPESKDGDRFRLRNISNSLVVAEFFDLKEAEPVTEASNAENVETGTKPKIILKKTVKINSKNKSGAEKRSQEGEDEGGGEGEKRKKLEVTASSPLHRCCLCIYEGKTFDSTSKVSPVTKHEKEVLSYFYEFEIKLLCHIHHVRIFTPTGKKCSDPYERHTRRNELTRFRILDLSIIKTAEKFLTEQESGKLKPLMKVCQPCFDFIGKKIEDGKESLLESENPSGSQRSEYSNFSDDMSDMTSQSQPKSQPQEPQPTLEELGKKIEDLELKEDDLNEIYQNIKHRISEVDDDKKIELLNVLPKSYSNNRKVQEMGVGRRLVEKANEYRESGKERERQKRKDRLSEEDIERVKAFYRRRDISRECPGAKQYVSVKIGGERVRLQKHLLLHRLDKAHQKFRDEHEDIIIGLSKFCKLRPPEIVLAGSEGTHNICVCLHHQNPKLMITSSIVGADPTFKELQKKKPHQELTAVQLLDEITCDPDDLDCVMGLSHCDECSQLAEEMRLSFIEICECLNILEISYDQWLATDYSAIHTLNDPVEIFARNFIEALKNLKQHHFLSARQEENFNDQLKNLKPNHLLIELDFSENYVFKSQDSIQHNYFINRQCTLHPAVIHFSPRDKKCVLFISPSMSHTAAEVALFIKRLHGDIISRDFQNTKYIHYWSDGAPTQVR